ncbi:hypothetical protein GCM10010517_02650 [Streptosporangium fragile]|uniref:Uncharacterized protein n=1 Tax=Streptosporangium fragile TaxID=46186 RepID=A0ABN3VP61_9ACTN
MTLVLGVGDLVGAALDVVTTGAGRVGPSPGQPTTDSGVPVNKPPTMAASETSANVPTATPTILRNCLRLPL